jgi:hypothetical protein
MYSTTNRTALLYLNYPDLREMNRGKYCSPIFFRIIKSRTLRWTGHVAWIKERGAVFIGRGTFGMLGRRWLENNEIEIDYGN